MLCPSHFTVTNQQHVQCLFPLIFGAADAVLSFLATLQ